MTVWFTSDEHYGHANIIKHCNRPYRDVHEMNRALIENHNRRVKPYDLVIHLGDFCWDKKDVKRTLARLHGTHRLVVGNHDGCFRKSAKSSGNGLEYYVGTGGFQLIFDGTVTVANEGDYWNDEKLDLCHFPYLRDDEEHARYEEHRPKPRLGVTLLHGHVHTAWKQKDNMINVGVDVWDYAPVSLEEIKKLAQ